MRASPHYYPPWTFLIFAIPSYCGYESDDHHQNNGNGPGGRVELTGLYPGPYFDIERNHQNVSTHVGTTAYLPCYVKQLGNKSVAWIRKVDSHIVTVDRYTFIADERFQVIAAPPGDSWILQIKYVQPRDDGVYECQISTEPKLSYPIYLTVLVPTIRLEPQESPHIWESPQSILQLKCIVQDSLPDNVGKILWYHNGQLLDKNDDKNSITFQSKIEDEMIVETATFRGVQRSQSGNWTCYLNTVGFASATVVVTGGEASASLQRPTYGVSSSSYSLILSLSSTTYQKLEAVLLIFLLYLVEL
ncbi:zwei Ig domain protein zig-8 [Folsomia candida]|uniref:zwei Ig domain protein zig-8 n=1 Tax=Folsomia candida TaxID=158441 RepID=UPI001604F02D|nr:zwei Ig domain protein zig-8 [Folsomia candida]XP_035709919.1 zwei Ig domain protein zig-8 [Folsomia candida]XP_035709926.1 zwei Ig domain protein zig-8 [Folsomia candida]